MTVRGQPHTVVLVALLGLAMITATFLQGALSVLSVFIIEDFSVSRSAFGLAFAVFSLTGALLSPWIGGVSDTRPKAIMLALFGFGAVALLVVASAARFEFVIAGCAVSGVAVGAGNPVTNRVIAHEIPLGHRGLVVGLKQAGPPVGLLIAGMLLPAVALRSGWRMAMMLSVLIPVVGLMVTQSILTSSTTETTRRSESQHQRQELVLSPSVVRLSLTGLGVALAMSAAIAFVPLYAQEEIGVTPSVAGALAASMGLAGVAGRVFWSVIGGRGRHPSRTLVGIAVIASFGLMLMVLSGNGARWLLWTAVLAVGFSLLAWHAVAWLSVIHSTGVVGVGRASGVVQIGNSVGFAGGPLLMGLLVDATHSYSVAWSVIAVGMALLSAVLAWTERDKAKSEAGVIPNV